MVDSSELVDNALVGGNADHSAGTLTVHGEAFGHAVANDAENVGRQAGKLFKDFAYFFFFAGIINVCNVQEENDVFAWYGSFLQQCQHAVHILTAQAVAGRIVRRSVQQIQQVILLSKQLVNLFLQSRQVELIVFVQHFIGGEIAAHILAQHFVCTPVPIGAEHGITVIGVVPDSMVDSTGAACGCNCGNVAFRTGVAEGSSQYAVQIFRQTADRCVSNHFVSGKTAENLFYSRQADELFILVQNSADGSVGNGILAVFGSSCHCSSVSTENFILGRFTLSVFCSNTHSHN